MGNGPSSFFLARGRGPHENAARPVTARDTAKAARPAAQLVRRRNGIAVQEFVVIFLANAACIFVLIAVHEAGHFLAGWVGGIPVGEMRLLTFPQHVALRDGEEW